MGASLMSIEGAIAATVLLALVALLIAPFSAIFVLAAGIIVIASMLIWGKRGTSGEVEGRSDEPPGDLTTESGGEPRGQEALRQPSGESGVAGRDADADPVSSGAEAERPARGPR